MDFFYGSGIPNSRRRYSRREKLVLIMLFLIYPQLALSTLTPMRTISGIALRLLEYYDSLG